MIGTQWIVGKAVWDDWGWRLPFIFSLALLAISLWMRLMLRESPVFVAMKAGGAQSRNPLKEAFTYPGNKRRMLVAMIGIAAGFTVIAYTVMFQALYFLQNGLHVASGMAQLLVGAALLRAWRPLSSSAGCPTGWAGKSPSSSAMRWSCCC